MIIESMIRLTTSAPTIEPAIISNTLASTSVGFPLRSSSVMISVFNSGIPPILLPIPVCELITYALSCVSEFMTRTPGYSIYLETSPRTYQLSVED
ncbi:hypothetical protein TNCV_3897081 [Trichonephila clavipes]|nr:hypothetical protein TNCV_3897081 [Trichonephila clavipes]